MVQSVVLPGDGGQHVGVEHARDALGHAVAEPQGAQRLVPQRAQVQRVAAPQTLHIHQITHI